MKIYLLNNNTCTRVKLYGIDVKNNFLCNEHTITNKIEDADIILVNTCSFLKSKEEYFVKLIKELYNNKKTSQRIAVIGCLPNVNRQAIEEIGSDILMFARDINEIKSHFNLTNSPITKATCVKDKLRFKQKILYWFNKLILHSKHIEYRLKRNKVCYLQISTGCLGRCAYCSERFITKLKSRPVEEIIDAIKDGYARGYRLFALNSDDASAYGKDLGTSLENLLLKVIEMKENFHITIPEFNPGGLTPKVLECLKNKKFLYITIPIQSGSQKILNLMRRPYNIEEVIEKVRIIRVLNKKLKINTHIIVGFPGETEEDFNATKKVLESGLFDRVKVFKYSERPNTEALMLPDKVDPKIKDFRALKLLKTMKKANLKKLSLTNLILNKEQIK